MTVPDYLVASRRARVTDLPRDLDPYKCLQHPIDGSARNLRGSRPNVDEDLIGGRVIGTGRQCFQNHSALDGKRQTVAPAYLFCFLQREAPRHGCNVIAFGILLSIDKQTSSSDIFGAFDSIQPLTGVFDGFLLIGGGGLLRTDLSVNAFKLVSETDVAIGGNQVGVSQPDSDHFRRWEVAGTAHLDLWFQQAVLPLQIRDGVTQIPDNPPCTNPPFSRNPYHFALNAATDQMVL